MLEAELKLRQHLLLPKDTHLFQHLHHDIHAKVMIQFYRHRNLKSSEIPATEFWWLSMRKARRIPAG